ncbi:MAG: amino acid adenylation domain-containing protein, partial [Myxococcota bacterium]|nr:amino acid adenylation domain-containing protein [Myxococcota bacterium]
TLANKTDLEKWIDERTTEPLGPGGRLWEAALLSAGADRHVFYLCQHHIISDGLSMINLLERLSERYAGSAPAKPETFAEYLASEAAYVSSEKAQKDRAYWKRYLQSPPPPIQLYGQERTDPSIGLSRVWIDQGEELTLRLRELSERSSFSAMTPALSRLITVSTGLVAFLSRACGNAEVLLGIPYGNRARRFADTYGLLMEQTFIRAQVDLEDTYESLASRVKHELLNGIRHGRCCVSDHDLQYATLNMLPAPPSTFGELPAQARIGPAPTRSNTSRFEGGDLRDTFGIQLFDFESQPLNIGFDFHTGTFNKAVQERVCDHFHRVLLEMAANPTARIDELSLLDEAEKQHILLFGRGHEESAAPLDVVEQFQAQTQSRPDKIAIHAADQTLNYAELDSHSNDLAHRLIEQGLQPGDRVALAMPRGAREVTAMLAILKANGVYMPLDARHPADRIRTILDDARPDYLVAPSDSPLTNLISDKTEHIALDQLHSSGSLATEPPPGIVPDPDSLGYILFTSGSTGRPKGVSVPRSALANFLRSMAHTPGMHEDDHLLAVTTTTFDISALELLLPLWTGATVTIADHDTTADPRRLRAMLDGGSFSLMQATPATWRMLLDAGWNGTKGFRILCGGEALSPEVARRLLNQGADLWNLYGPTETTIWSAAVQIEPDFDKITIGRPIDTTQILILDSQGELLPPGVVGEIYIGGAGLAQGYCDRPELTAKAFVSGLPADPSSRLYRTGDLGRLLEDGRFECLGRTDHQIKIRGFRIELGEIESVLLEHPGVDQVLAKADHGDDGDSSISVYWIGSASQADIQRIAQQKLPHYMLPSADLEMKAFPLNTSGKIDRRALPQAQRSSAPSSPDTLPRNDREVQVAGLWRTLLGVEEPGRDVNFFDAGGTSILIIQLRNRLEEEFGIEISLRACFDHPTVAGLSRYLEQPRASNASDPIVSVLRPGDETKPRLFCLYGVHLYQDLARAMPGTAPVLGIHIPIAYNPAVEPCPSVSDAAGRYVDVIRQHQPRGPYHLAGLCFGGLVAYEAAQQLEAAGEKVEVLAIFDTRLPQARKVRRLARIWSIVRSGLTTPRATLQRLNHRRLLHRASKLPRVSPQEHGLIELPLRGPRVEEQARSYAAEGRTIASKVLLFRATKEPDPEGLVYERDFGWHDLASQLQIFDIPGSHLEIIRKPHSGSVAEQIQRAIDHS